MFSSATPHPLRRPFIKQAPAGIAEWAACFDAAELPVLQSTSDAIEDMRVCEDAVDAHVLADVLSNDPLMTLKVLAHVARIRAGREGTDPETMTAALVMLGIGPFFRDFGPQPTIEDQLADRPEALQGFCSVLDRSHRAARFALAFAVQRMDHDAAVIHQAALLHDFVDLLMWLRAPDLALNVAEQQMTDGSLRTAAVQIKVFKIELPDLQHVLMRQWHLPDLLVDIADDHRGAASAQARTVLLAIRLARHTASDWNNPALVDDVSDIAVLLNMGRQPTLDLLHDIDDH